MSDNIEQLKNQVDAKIRTLSATWSLSTAFHNNNTNSNFEEELCNILVEEIQIERLYQERVTLQGWYGFRKELAQEWPEADIAAWCKKHCIGKYVHKPGMCIFENKDDAAKFTLTWC